MGRQLIGKSGIPVEFSSDTFGSIAADPKLLDALLEHVCKSGRVLDRLALSFKAAEAELSTSDEMTAKGKAAAITAERNKASNTVEAKAVLDLLEGLQVQGENYTEALQLPKRDQTLMTAAHDREVRDFMRGLEPDKQLALYTSNPAAQAAVEDAPAAFLHGISPEHIETCRAARLQEAYPVEHANAEACELAVALIRSNVQMFAKALGATPNHE